MNADIPTVTGKLKPGRGLYLVQIHCPYCGKKHTHGAGSDGSAANGHRVAHCGIRGRRYNIKVPDSEFKKLGLK